MYGKKGVGGLDKMTRVSLGRSKSVLGAFSLDMSSLVKTMGRSDSTITTLSWQFCCGLGCVLICLDLVMHVVLSHVGLGVGDGARW